jgi:hypothetical protein
VCACCLSVFFHCLFVVCYHISHIVVVVVVAVNLLQCPIELFHWMKQPHCPLAQSVRILLLVLFVVVVIIVIIVVVVCHHCVVIIVDVVVIVCFPPLILTHTHTHTHTHTGKDLQKHKLPARRALSMGPTAQDDPITKEFHLQLMQSSGEDIEVGGLLLLFVCWLVGWMVVVVVVVGCFGLGVGCWLFVCWLVVCLFVLFVCLFVCFDCSSLFCCSC